jgi:hypothetical protein
MGENENDGGHDLNMRAMALDMAVRNQVGGNNHPSTVINAAQMFYVFLSAKPEVVNG